MRAIYPIGKAVVCDHVIELGRWLVVPRCPGPGAIHADDNSLIAGQNHAGRIVGVKPQAVVIIAAGSALDGVKSFPAVGGSIRRGITHIDYIRILAIHGDAAEIPSPSPNAWVGIGQSPVRARVIGAIDAALFRVRQKVNAAGLSGCHGNAHPSEPVRRQAVPGDLLPIVPAIRRFVEPAARPIRWRINIPRRPPSLPKRSVDDSRIARVKGKIDGSGILVFKKHALPRLAAVGGAEHTALGIRGVRVAEHCRENHVRIVGVYEDAPDLPTVLEPDMRPGAAGVLRFVHPVAVGNVRAHVRLARTHINHLGVRRRNRNGADGSDGLAVKDGRPHAAGVRGFPNTSAHRAKIKSVGLPGNAGGRKRPPAARGADHAPVKTGKEAGIKLLPGQAGGH